MIGFMPSLLRKLSERERTILEKSKIQSYIEIAYNSFVGVYVCVCMCMCVWVYVCVCVSRLYLRIIVCSRICER